MPKYLAQYKINAFEYSFGGWEPYEDRKEFKFDAENEDEAKKIAEEHRREIRRKKLIGGNATLESLLEIKKINLS